MRTSPAREHDPDPVVGEELRPGGLQHLVQAIADAGASVRDIRHERAFGGPDVSTVLVDCTLEVRDAAHGRAVLGAIGDAGISIRRTASAQEGPGVPA